MCSHLLECKMQHRTEIQSPFCQVHSHLLECTMWHRTEIQKPILSSALTSAWMHNAAQDRDSKKKGTQNTNQMQKFIINLYKVKEHVSVSSSVTWISKQCNVLVRRKGGIWYSLPCVQRQSVDCWLSPGQVWEWIRASKWERQSFPEPALPYSLEGCSVALVLLEHHLGLVK